MCKKVFGYIPENLSFEWMPLREQTEQEKSIIKTEDLNRIVTAFSNGFMPSEKAVEIINKNKLFDVDLEENEAISLDEMQQKTEETLGETAKGKGETKSNV